jgi:hypothetical protein
MFVQFCAAVIGFGIWACLVSHDISASGDVVATNSLPDGSEEYLAFLVFRVIPAAAVLCVLMTIEWLFYRLYFTEKN